MLLHHRGAPIPRSADSPESRAARCRRCGQPSPALARPPPRWPGFAASAPNVLPGRPHRSSPDGPACRVRARSSVRPGQPRRQRSLPEPERVRPPASGPPAGCASRPWRGLRTPRLRGRHRSCPVIWSGPRRAPRRYGGPQAGTPPAHRRTRHQPMRPQRTTAPGRPDDAIDRPSGPSGRGPGPASAREASRARCPSPRPARPAAIAPRPCARWSVGGCADRESRRCRSGGWPGPASRTSMPYRARRSRRRGTRHSQCGRPRVPCRVRS